MLQLKRNVGEEIILRDAKTGRVYGRIKYLRMEDQSIYLGFDFDRGVSIERVEADGSTRFSNAERRQIESWPSSEERGRIVPTYTMSYSPSPGSAVGPQFVLSRGSGPVTLLGENFAVAHREAKRTAGEERAKLVVDESTFPEDIGNHR